MLRYRQSSDTSGISTLIDKLPKSSTVASLFCIHLKTSAVLFEIE